MSFAIDTNILVYAHFEDFPEHRVVRDFLHRHLKEGTLYYVGWQVYYEYIRLTTHPQVLRTPLTASKAAADLDSYWQSPRCQVLVETVDHLDHVNKLFKNIPSAKGNFIHDCHYAALLQEHGIKTIVTLDSDFKKFDFLKVINPVIGQ